jgi:Cd2+/Zn2+-exporting ATPase
MEKGKSKNKKFKKFKKAFKSKKVTIIRIASGLVLFALGLILENVLPEVNGYVWLAVYIPAFLISGIDVLTKAAGNIRHGKVFDENLLMTIATVGAFFVGEYPEAAAVMLFYQTGELFQQFAVEKSRKSIAKLMDIRPDYANVKKDGEIIKFDPDEVAVDDIIVIKAGEKIPLDAVVVEGVSSVDTSALTGESLSREVEIGSALLSGSVNISGLLTARVTKVFGESTVSKILELVENAGANKSKSENFISKFARYYTPSVVLVAFLLAVIPPVVIGATGGGWNSFSDWIYRALTFLVISCPCALVISIPLSFFGGIGGASKRGILVKGGNYLEALAKAEIAAFDKTGTLTKGVFKVQSVNSEVVDKEKLLKTAAYAESFSNHPIAVSLKEAYGREIETAKIYAVEEIAGHGIKCVIDGKKILVGNDKLMNLYSISNFKENKASGTIVYVASDGEFLGSIVIADEIKADAQQAVADLNKMGVKTVMLTGDSKLIGEDIARKLEIDEAHCQLLPSDKVDIIEAFMQRKSAKGKLLFAGDGVNDAPVLARSDIGIAMGGLGSDAAIEAADVVIMTDEPSKIAESIRISKKTLRIVYENIIFSLAVKGVVLVLGALGIADMWEAVFADVGVSVIAILNAIRMLRVKKK